MAVYAIGDVQGCYSSLCRLLESIRFDESVDHLWFCGDLVNRGPESLETLRFVRSLGERAITVLGNHDLHLLALYHGDKTLDESDTLYKLLKSRDCDELMLWLQSRPLMHLDNHLDMALVHAGIHPDWPLSQAFAFAAEVETALKSDSAAAFFAAMYGNQPDRWRDDLSGMPRLRCITNILTRMRFIKPDGRLDMKANGNPAQHSELTPWFESHQRRQESTKIVFGHWSTLPPDRYGNYFAIDGGCIWGGNFVALRIDVDSPQWYSVKCQELH